jgi:hypothetical protein
MMDVPVSHLNNRLAVQLPVELPLGLVFVVGRVEHLHQALEVDSEGKEDRTSFDLVEKRYSIRCELSDRAAEEVSLGEGARVRAGGHLVFDTHRANYYLLARDVEAVSDSAQATSTVPETNVIDHTLGRQALTPILADIKRRAESTHLEEANLPYWVQRLAPPEIKKELALSDTGSVKTADSPSESTIDDDLISALSEAMDSDQEVELTVEMLAKLSPTAARKPRPSTAQNNYQAAAISITRPSEQQNLILPLILVFFAVVLIVILLIFLIF